MNQRMMAFWKYDLFPYLAWGEIKSITNDGGCYIENLGGYIFSPEFILDFADGEKLANSLEELKRKRYKELEALNNKYISMINTAIQSAKGR